MILRLMSFLFVCCLVFTAKAQPVTEKKDGALYVKSANTAEAEELFTQYGFNQFSKINFKFPRIYFLHFPSDWKEIPESDEKNTVFIKILMPLILKVNESVLAERAEVERMFNKTENQQKLTAEEQTLLDNLAQKYDAFTRLKDEEKHKVLLKQLLLKIDAVPPSILIATAGIYSNWGMSRLATQGNSLYLRELWYEEDGLKPLDDENADYSYKTYNSLEESIYDQILKINSGINYTYFRDSRQKARQIDRPLYGPQVAATLLLDSNQKSIAGMIDYTFTYYKLQNADYKPQLEDIK